MKAAGAPQLDAPAPLAEPGGGYGFAFSDLEGRVLSLSRDAAGELYVLTNDELGPFGVTGKVYRLAAAP